MKRLITIAAISICLNGNVAVAASDQAIQQSWGELTQIIEALNSSPEMSALKNLHHEMQNHKWRTIYEFTQVSKKPLPGTRLGLEALPTMTQLDAENYLVAGAMPGLPGLNCPARGGAPGRPIVLTIGRGTMTITDNGLQQLFAKASPDQGEMAWKLFDQVRNNICASTYNYAQLSFRWEKFQSVKSNWNKCQEDGVYLSKWEKEEKFHFPGNHKRTAAVGGGVLFYCGGARGLDKHNEPSGGQSDYSGGGDDLLNYESWFKWSDHDREPLNILQTLREAGNSPNKCPNTCIPLIHGGGASASICIGIDPDISAAGETIPMRFGAEFHAYDRDKSLCTPKIDIPAPFGVAESLGEMADSAKQSAMNKMKDKLTSLLPGVAQLQEKLAKVATMQRQASSLMSGGPRHH